MIEFRIDKEKCIGCKKCYNACFVDVFRWDEINKRPIVAYPEDCAKCNWCVMVCSRKCLTVIPDHDFRWGKIE